MANPLNLYFPNSEYIGNSASPINLTIYEYQTGNFLSFFSGSYISNVSGSYFNDVGVVQNYHSDSLIYDLYIPSSSYLGTGYDLSYSVVVYNYRSGAIITDYSASTITAISPLTITDFIERPV